MIAGHGPSREIRRSARLALLRMLDAEARRSECSVVSSGREEPSVHAKLRMVAARADLTLQD